MQKIIVAVTGASGAIFGFRLLELLGELQIERHLIISKSGLLTSHQELGIKKSDWLNQCEFEHPWQDIGASCASGSFIHDGMIIAPCSMKTLAEIANGITSSLISRAAEVTLKERRKLVLLTRESPLTASHINNMAIVTQMGGIISPPVPAFYIQPQSIDDLVNHTVGRALDLFGIDNSSVQRWNGLKAFQNNKPTPDINP